MGMLTELHPLPAWIRYIKNRIERNKNFLVFFEGQTGSGKSYSSLSVAEMLDPRFNENNIVFTVKELMDLINGGTLKKGSVIIFEEAGVELFNKNWQSMVNKVMSFLVQTFRHRNYILIMNAPQFGFLDKGIRTMFHAVWKSKKIDFEKRKCHTKPLLIEYNAERDKFYKKFLIINDSKQRRRTMKIKNWKIPAPSEEMLEKYEAKKLDFTIKLNERISTEIQASQKKTEKKPRPLWRCKKCSKQWRPYNPVPDTCRRDGCQSDDFEKVKEEK